MRMWHVSVVHPNTTPRFVHTHAAPQQSTSTIVRMRGNHGRPTPIHQDSVLPWLTETQGATPTPLPLRVQPTATAGNALIATSDVPAGAPLLTLPCDACIVQPFDNAPDDTSALGPMALALLQRLAAGTDPWLDALPRRVDLPWLTWEPQELAALQDIETRQEAAHLQQCLMQLYQSSSSRLAALSMDIEHLSWAYSLVLSRSFRLPPPHNLRVLAPGIDLCNHDWAPTAIVRHNASPDASQGLAALAEVAEVAGLEPAGARMELVAGPDGVAAGSGVTICYHSHPNDVFLLYYGFVPENNPHDSVVLFASVEEAVRFLDEEVHPQQPPPAAASLRAQVLNLSLALEFPEIDSWQRLFVSAEGFDQRLLILVDALCREHLLGWPLLESSADLVRGEGPAELPTRVLESSVFDELAPEELQAEGYEVLCLRCEALLREYPTSLEQDARELQQLRGTEGDRRQLALRYRANKKRVLLNAIQHMRSQ